MRGGRRSTRCCAVNSTAPPPWPASRQPRSGCWHDSDDEGGSMADLKVEIDAADAGFAPDRLDRIDKHFARYVDDGLLPGWLIVVSRGGQIVHLSTYGQRDME